MLLGRDSCFELLKEFQNLEPSLLTQN